MKHNTKENFVNELATGMTENSQTARRDAVACNSNYLHRRTFVFVAVGDVAEVVLSLVDHAPGRVVAVQIAAEVVLQMALVLENDATAQNRWVVPAHTSQSETGHVRLARVRHSVGCGAVPNSDLWYIFRRQVLT